MKRVIIPLDGSELDDHAVSLGERMAEAFGATIELIYVLTATPQCRPGKYRTRWRWIVTSIASPRASHRDSQRRLPYWRAIRAKSCSPSARTRGALMVMAAHGKGAAEASLRQHGRPACA
jgi:hypothetical protein